MAAKPTVLLVDDEPQIRFAVRRYLESRDFAIMEADSCATALEACRKGVPDAILMDYNLPDGNALDLMPQLQAIQPSVPIILLTGHGTVDLAVRAMQEGAEHFLTKPLELSTLHVILERALDNQRNRLKVTATESKNTREAQNAFIGTSTAIRQLAKFAENALRTDGPVLIEGETGIGKGTLAVWLHRHSSRSKEAIVDLNCAGLSRDLLETELFGHEKGAFTGAVTSKTGLLEVAHRGTVFLDELGDADLVVQAKLLKVLEEKRFRRLGDVRDRQVNVRLIAASHRDLRALIKENKFRADLYFRISTVVLRIPPLRERIEDIPPLAQCLLEKIRHDLKSPNAELTPDAMAELQRYSWPGNIRELRNILERAVLLSEDGRLRPPHLRFEFAADGHPSSPASFSGATDTSFTLEEMQRRYMQKVIEEEGGNVDRAAKRLDVPRSSLYKKIKSMDLVVSKEPAENL